MLRRIKNRTFLVIAIGGIMMANFCVTLFAADDVEALKKQIAVLEQRIAQLESCSNSSAPQAPDVVAPAAYLPVVYMRHWDPFVEMMRLREETDRMFRDSLDWGGSLNRGMLRSNLSYDADFAVKEEKDKYIIEFDLTGVDQDKLDIQINPKLITIKGEQTSEQKQQNQNNYMVSKSYSTFVRSIPTPPNADTKKMKTEKDGDKLIITLPKK